MTELKTSLPTLCVAVLLSMLFGAVLEYQALQPRLAVCAEQDERIRMLELEVQGLRQKLFAFAADAGNELAPAAGTWGKFPLRTAGPHEHNWQTGPRGGVFYWTEHGTKVYMHGHLK